MCGGEYKVWNGMIRHMFEINGEEIVARTIRLLRENGVDNIAISSNNMAFVKYGLPLLQHKNEYVSYGFNKHEGKGHWCDAFYPTDDPACYIFGDVVFSPEAIKTIIQTETDDIEFFASAPPFSPEYPKSWAEPFALKVVNQKHLREAIQRTKELAEQGEFAIDPIMWHLWRVIKGKGIEKKDINWTVINDYTCDVDKWSDAIYYKKILKEKEG